MRLASFLRRVALFAAWIVMVLGNTRPAVAATHVSLGGGIGTVSLTRLHGTFPGMTAEVAWGGTIASLPLRFDYNLLPHGEGGQFDGTVGLRFSSPPARLRVYVDIGSGLSAAHNADFQGLCGTFGAGVVVGPGKSGVWLDVRRLNVANYESSGARATLVRIGAQLM